MDAPVKHKRKTPCEPVPDKEGQRAEAASHGGARTQEMASSQDDNADISAVADLGYN